MAPCFGQNAWLLVIRATNAGLAPTAELQTTSQTTVDTLLFIPTNNTHLSTEHLAPDHQTVYSVECSIREIALAETTVIGTAVLPVKKITLESLSQQGRDPSLVSNNILTSLQPLTLKCETSLSQQVRFSMPSTSTLICCELRYSAYSQPSDFTHHSFHDSLSSSLNITRYYNYSSLSVIIMLQQTYYLLNTMNAMHLSFQHHSHDQPCSNTQHHLLINFYHTTILLAGKHL